MKILVPIAGDNQSVNTPYIRSLYEIKRKAIFQYVYEFLNQIEEGEFIVAIRREDINNYHFDDMLRLMIPSVKIITVERPTKGSACTCLLALEEIEEEAPLIIASSNQIFLPNPMDAIREFQSKNYDGGIVVFEDIHPRWSFVSLNDKGLVNQVAEKRPISKNATSGLFYFKRGADFVVSAQKMIKKNASVKGNFFVAPAYNEMVLMQKKIGVYRIKKEEYFKLNDEGGIEEYHRYLEENAE